MSPKPLAGVTILITRPTAQASALSSLLQEQGAETLEVATIELRRVRDRDRIGQSLRHLPDYDWVLFTSVNGVDYFLAEVEKSPTAGEGLARKNLACIGPATAARLAHYSLRAQLVASDSRAEGLVAALKTRLGESSLNGMKFLLPRAQEAREILPQALRQLGARVDDVAVYRSVAPPIDFQLIDTALSGRPLGVATFTSSSAARNFLRAAVAAGRPHFLEGVCVAAIGPVTAETLGRWGVRTDIMPARSTIAGLAAAIVAYFSPET